MKFAKYVEFEKTVDLFVDRRKVSIELSGIISDLCKTKEALSNGKLSKEDGEFMLDRMIQGMAKLNGFINKCDYIKIH